MLRFFLWVWEQESKRGVLDLLRSTVMNLQTQWKYRANWHATASGHLSMCAKIHQLGVNLTSSEVETDGDQILGLWKSYMRMCSFDWCLWNWMDTCLAKWRFQNIKWLWNWTTDMVLRQKHPAAWSLFQKPNPFSCYWYLQLPAFSDDSEYIG